jgi:hypothetical protein
LEALAYRRAASVKETPNLFSALPVAILAWPPAATSGLTRKTIGARRPSSPATWATSFSSGSDSTLISDTPAFRAKAISPRVLPTPEKTIRSPGIPAARARRISPSDTVSAPAPRLPRVRSTETLLLALTA